MALQAQMDSPNRLLRISRQEFVKDRWEYNPGEHVTFVGNNGSGKTYLAFELLGVTVKPDLVGIVLVMKPKDSEPVKWQKRLNFKRISTWPPTVKDRVWDKYKGYIAWPKLGDIDADDARSRALFYKVLSESYAQAAKPKSQDRIIVADETVGIAKELKLERQLNSIWMRGRSMGLGLWAMGQRPFNMPQNAYEQAVHVFFWRATDKRNRTRYKEIGGIDPDLVEQTVNGLQGRDCLYIKRTHEGGYRACIVAES